MGLQYVGELVAAFIERAGGSVKGKVFDRSRPGRPAADLRSPPVAHPFGNPRRLAPWLNNYIANQIFLEIGGHRLGGPVSLEKSLQVANEMLSKHGLGRFHPSRGRVGHQPRPLAPPRENWLIATGVIGVCFSAERTVLPLRTAWIVLKFTASAEFSAS